MRLKLSKSYARLASRQKAWDKARIQAEKMHEDRGSSYTKRPGSHKKPFPRGIGKRHGA